MLYHIRNFAISFVASLLIFGLLAYFLVSFITASFIIDDPGPYDDNGASNGNGPYQDFRPDFRDRRDDDLTILFIGLDSGASQTDGSIEADSIMLLNINSLRRLCMFSTIPPETLVRYRGYNYRIGALYSEDDGGIRAITEVIRAITGLSIDHYFIMNYEGFYTILRELGPIRFHVPQDMYHNPNGLEEPEINLRAGLNMLTPEQALQLLRFRGYDYGGVDRDIRRMETHRSFVREVLRTFFTGGNIFRANELFRILEMNVITSMSAEDFVFYSELILSFPEFSTIDVPFEGQYNIKNGVRIFEHETGRVMDRFRRFRDPDAT